MRSGASSRQAQALRKNTTSKGCRPLFIAWRENTASPANRAMEMVIQITPATGSPTEDGAIAVLLSLSLASDICVASLTCAGCAMAPTPRGTNPRGTNPVTQAPWHRSAQNARARCLRQTAGLFRGEALLRQREHAQRASSPRTNSTRRRCATKRNAFCLERRTDDVAGAGLVVRRHCLRLA